jgi:O-antigen/teichoic acid export membrane protein
MSGIRRAMLITVSERYFALGIGFVTMAVISRLLTPQEIGLSVIGMAVVVFAISAQEFASPNFLIQHQNLTLEEIRKAFAVMFLLTLAITLLLAISAPWIARAYEEEGLVPYLRVLSAGILLELISAPVVALFRREMEFGKVAIINVSKAATTAVATIGLALLGFSYMSFAWAWFASAAVSGLLAPYLYGDRRIYMPLFGDWRGMLTFGGCNGANVFLHRIYESMPYLMLGRILSLDAAAYFSRGTMICQLPDKVFLQGVVSVILPAFSSKVRSGRSLRELYLRAIAIITGIQWPALIVLALLAHPIVQILLGAQWFAIVPLIQVMAIATMFSFSFELNYPVLLSMGAVRDALQRALLIWPASALIVTTFAFFGLRAAAWSLLIAVPFQALVSLHFVRRHISLGWLSIGEALWRSIVVTGASAVGPAAVIMLSGFRSDLSIWQGTLAGVLAAAGWFVGLILTRHVLFEEIRRAAAELGLARIATGLSILQEAWSPGPRLQVFRHRLLKRFAVSSKAHEWLGGGRESPKRDERVEPNGGALIQCSASASPSACPSSGSRRLP